MGLHDYLKRRRERDSAAADSDTQPKRRAELRDAWLALETDYPDRALSLARPYMDAEEPSLAADAKKLVGLVLFRRGEYAEALELFRVVAAASDNAGDWFNVVTSATLGGNIELGKEAFQHAIAAQQHGDAAEGLSVPLMRQYYACALRDRGEYEKAFVQIEKLCPIYEQLKITDDTFLHIRGVPFLSHTMDVAVDVFRGLGDSFDWKSWIESLARKLDDEGREYLDSVKRRLMEDT